MIVGVSTNSINYAITPILINYYKNNEISQLRKLSNSLFNIVLLSFIGLAIIQSFFAAQIVGILLPGFSGIKLELTINFYRIQAFLSVITVLTGILISLHYTYKNMYRTVIIPAVGYLFFIIFVVFSYKKLGIYSLLYGLVLSQINNFLLLSFPFIKHYKFSVKFNKEIIDAFKKVYPLLISGIFSKSNIIVDRFFASSLGGGSIALLQYGRRIINSITSFTNRGISIVSLRDFSLIQDDDRKFQKQFIFIFKSMVFIILPVVFLVVFFLKDILKVIIFSGRLSDNDVINIYLVVCAFIGIFIGGSLSGIIVNTFYSKGLTSLISKITIIMHTLGICIKIGLFFLIGFWGLPIAFSIHSLLNIIVLLMLYNRYIHKIEFSIIFSYIFRVLAISSITILFPVIINNFLNHSILSAFLSSAFYIVLYFLFSIVLEKDISFYILNKLKKVMAQ